MKKRNLFFIPSFLLTLFSCQGNPSGTLTGSQIYATKMEGLDSYVEIQSSEELNSIARFDNALVIVTQPFCSACEGLYPILKDLIQEYHYLIYTVDVSIYNVNYLAEDNRIGTYAFLYQEVKGTPTFLYFRDGKAVDAYGGFNADTAKEKILSHFVDRDIYLVNDLAETENGSYTFDHSAKLDSLGYGTKTLEDILSRQSRERINILFSWRRCKDCKEYKERVLYPYLANNEHGPVYVYELDGYYLLKRSEDESLMEEGLSLFSDFSRKFFLADYPVEDSLGNLAGVAPTLVTYYQNSHAISVFRNDFDPFINKGGTVSYGQSFYPDVLSLKSDSTADKVSSPAFAKALDELSDKAGNLEVEKTTAFLEEYL